MSDVLIDRPELDGLGVYEFGWHDPDVAGASAKRGLSEAVVRDISRLKNEPEWMLKARLKGHQLFERKPMPTWGADLSDIDFENIKYFVRSTEKQAASWEDLPEDIRNTYDKLGIPEAEKKYLAGVKAQYESEVVYGSLQEDLADQGVLFTQAHSSNGVCTPSRYALLTGQYNWRAFNGISSHYGVGPIAEIPRLSDTTIAEFLRVQGYDTAAFVENPLVQNEENGFRRGFESFFEEADVFAIHQEGDGARGGNNSSLCVAVAVLVALGQGRLPTVAGGVFQVSKILAWLDVLHGGVVQFHDAAHRLDVVLGQRLGHVIATGIAITGERAFHAGQLRRLLVRMAGHDRRDRTGQGAALV